MTLPIACYLVEFGTPSGSGRLNGWRARFGCEGWHGIGPATCAPRKPTVGQRSTSTD